MCNKKDKQKLILEAAEYLFLTNGYEQTSTKDIAKKAGCNAALLHYYYHTKEQLFMAIFEEKVCQFAESFVHIDDAETFQENIRRRVDRISEWLISNPLVPFMIVTQIMTSKQHMDVLKVKLQAILGDYSKMIQKKLDEEYENGNIRKTTFLDLAITVLSQVSFLFLIKYGIQRVCDFSDDELEVFIEHRKAENFRIVLESLKPE